MAFWNLKHFSQLQVRQHKVTITIPDRFRLVSRMPSNLKKQKAIQFTQTKVGQSQSTTAGKHKW